VRRCSCQHRPAAASAPIRVAAPSLAEGARGSFPQTGESIHAVARPVQRAVPTRRLGSPAETVTTYCNATSLLEMHGVDDGTTEVSEPSAINRLESSILRDVAGEMQRNNVDKAARDIFTFYICVRWVPDDIFWQMARQELSTDLVQSVVNQSESLPQAISELYQHYKFVPLLCSQNLKVFDETDPEDGTYFRTFQKEVSSLSTWLANHSTDTVAQRLKSVDEVFCGSNNMNDGSCLRGISRGEWLNSMTSALGSWGWNAETTEDKWAKMLNLFESFRADEHGQTDAWASNVSAWRNKFPFHSFVHKPQGMPASSSPTSSQRFLVCFGMRVASQLHRRPSGQHIMTDQNNVGCHGFWDTTEVSDMVARMVELWKPPTCQLSEMTYVMKREFLLMYADMNKALFDALPSMIQDEDLLDAGLLAADTAGPLPYNPQSITVDGVNMIDGMRVRSKVQIKDPSDCTTSWISSMFSDNSCRHVVEVGDYGTVVVSVSGFTVAWDRDTANTIAVPVANINIVPHDWKHGSSVVAHMTGGFVAGVANIADGVNTLFDGLFRSRYTSLAEMMSGSTSKWVVCPVRGDANYTTLDSHLGVEDAAFQDIQREAYSSWTGYVAKVPGEDCETPSFFSVASYPGGQVCEIAELHADHLEKYTNASGVLEQFLCPLKKSLPAPEQLTVLKEKSGTCYLHMTPEQQRHYQWPYNGNFPGRRQFDRKPNMPNVEYELIRLMHVPENGNVSYARTCGPDELLETPRFCRAPVFQRPYSSMASMATAIGEAAVGSTTMGASAVTSSVANYQAVNAGEKNLSQVVTDTAEMMGEHFWDSLTGVGRLLHSRTSSAASRLTYGLPGASHRDAHLDAEIFQEAEAGTLLHQLSFQHSIGVSGASSNSKERYQRFVMTMPCADFDPVLEFTVRKRWASVVLRLVQSAYGSGVQGVLSSPVVEFFVRGEGRLFHREHTQADNTTWHTFGASMSINSAGASDPPDCAWSWSWPSIRSCGPTELCERSGISCVPKVRVASTGWWSIVDQQLAATVAPMSSAGGAPLSDLHGLTATMYCGAKKDFNDTAPGPRTYSTLLECLQSGIRINAELRALSPWKLHLPDEVVVMVIFSTITQRQCKPEGSSTDVLSSALCSDAEQASGLDAHLTSAEKSSTDGVYQGLHTGAGFPEGTPREVYLRPEDILEAAGLLARS